MQNREVLYSFNRLCEWEPTHHREARLSDEYHGKATRNVTAPAGRFKGETITVCVRCREALR